jgi:DNA-binding HxlR family transcriptional regulator
MAHKTYGQYCAVATALDVVGERWSLLIVRELLGGPKRYVDLRDGLVHVSTDMLATRLRDLEAAGVIGRRVLPPPAASRVYELTPLGRGLEPVVDELARWGLGLLDERAEGQAFQPPWLERAVRAVIPSERAGVDLVVRYELPEGSFTLRIEERAVTTLDPDTRADVVVVGALEDLVRASATLAAGGRLTPGSGIELQGRTTAVRRLTRLYVPH